MHWSELVASRLGFTWAADARALQRLDSAPRVVEILQRVAIGGVSLYGEFVTAFERRKFKALAADSYTLELTLLRGPQPVPDDLRLFFTLDALTYSFDARVLSASGSEITLHTPASLNFGEQRHCERWIVPEAAGASARLAMQGNGDLAGPARVLDFSRSGLSLRMTGVNGALRSGARLARMRVIVGRSSIPVPRVEVRHVTPIGESGDVRVGIEIGVGRRPVPVRHVDFPLPAPRDAARSIHPSEEEGVRPPVDVVRYFNDKGERIAAILDTTFGERIGDPVPVVILPPATGRRKETLSGLALTITENFRRRGRHVAVLRFDGIRRHGESTNDPQSRKPGYDMIHSSMGQAIADIHATLDFVYDNERFRPSRVGVVSSSSASIEARRALAMDHGERIHYWISLAGSPDFHDTLKNICGGLDLLGSFRNGVPLGVVPVLGNPIDLDRFFEDAFSRGLVYLRDAMDEIACIRTPITWIYGRFDDWVRPERVLNLMSVREGGPREVMSIPTGHQMRTSEEAIEAFKLVAACLWRFIHRRPIRPYAPDARHVADVREAEKARLETARISDHRDFWRQYLERKDRYLGFDIIRETEAYRGLMQTQLEMLDLREGDVLLDAGCGTGNFATMLLEQPAGLIGHAARPSCIMLTDYVAEALDTARAKLEALNGHASATRLEFATVDLEISRLGSVAEAIAGEGVAWDVLGEGVEGMPPALARRLREHPDPLADTVARGEDPEDAHAAELASRHGAEAAEILSDLGRAARFVRRSLVASDLRAPAAAAPSPEAHDRLDASAVRWKRLAFGRATLRFTLPFADASYDRILSSLVLCYVHRPEATIREFHRMLRPGGVLVISSMKPDADVSRIYMRLIERLRTATDVAIPAGLTREDLLTSARTFLNKAAGILNLEEEGAFEFVDRDRLVAMLEGAGFRDVRAVDRFGDPPQAYVLSGRRP